MCPVCLPIDKMNDGAMIIILLLLAMFILVCRPKMARSRKRKKR